MNKIKILGTTYTIKKSDRKDPKMLGNDGYCDNSSKEIVLLKGLSIKQDIRCVDKPEKYANSVLRHEIIHAFFSESGMSDYCHNELLVDWIAVQFPKMFQVFNELDILE